MIFDTIKEFVGQFLPSTANNSIELISMGLGLFALFALIGCLRAIIRGIVRW